MHNDAYHHPNHHCWKYYGCIMIFLIILIIIAGDITDAKMMVIIHTDHCRRGCGYAVIITAFVFLLYIF